MIINERIEHISNMQPYVEKLKEHLNVHGISFSEKEGHLENVVFTKGNDMYKIAWDCFYRFSGLVYMQKGSIKEDKKSKEKQKNENLVDLVYVTDDMFINMYMRSFIDKHFKII